MAILNMKLVTQAVETLLNDNLDGYTIKRNVRRNKDPNMASREKGWIGIYKGEVKYEPFSTGTSPYLVSIDIPVEVQVTGRDGADVEDKLEDAIKEVCDVLISRSRNSRLDIGGTVGMILGCDIEYQHNEDTERHHHAAIITLHAEARA